MEGEGESSSGHSNLVSESGLVELGVNVYNQDEFEAGVMRQLDEEASKQAIEQQRKFTEKELQLLQREIGRVKDEVTRVSRTITNLLSNPLCNVVSELKELKGLQYRKKSQLHELEGRERILRQCLLKGDFSNLPSSSNDRPFSLPPGDQQGSHDLVKSGLLTPFGTSSTDRGVGTSKINDRSRKVTPSLTLTDFNWLGLKQNQPPGQKGKGKGPAKLKTPPSSSGNNEVPLRTGQSDSHTGDFGNESSNDFGMKYEESSIVCKSEHEITGNGNESNSIQTPKNEDEDYEPGNESEDDLYITDEELGGVEERGSKKRRIRELSSGDDSDGELVHVNWSKKPVGRSSRRKSSCLDDGDETIFKERIKRYKLTNDEAQVPSVDFEGGFKVPNVIWQKLYRYQQTGVKWLWELHCQQAGGIMGDEMGLGKTIQMIAFFAGLKISNLRSHVTRELGLGPIIIVCPATVLYQWVNEFHKWWPPFRVAILHDTGSYTGTKSSLLNRIVSCNGVIITTYACIRLYGDLLLRHQWDYVVLDEGHKIRNPDAEITLTCKQFVTPHRLILSGSPMQNNLKELWSLYDFVFPGKLGTLPVFMEQFSVPITLGGYVNASQIQVQTAYRCACVLRDTINPYLLRRLKTDVKLHLPDKSEQVLFCRLTDYQREIYEDYIKGPEVEAMLSGRRWVFSGLITLRKLCNHPDLVTYQKNNGEEEVEEDELITGSKRKSKEQMSVVSNDEEGFGYWCRSGKMIVVETLLRMWLKQKHKVLLFTQSRMMLNILESFVSSNGYSYLRMDGGTSIGSRQNIIKKFNEDPDCFVFLLTTRVGGLGVNLTGADRVIIYDPDWNPSTDTQAKERAWRIGQTKPVTIYRLLTSGTIEEKIYHRQIFKQFLTNRVLRDPRQRRFFKSNDLYDLFTLGSSDGPHKTETGVLFAGTGSEVKVPKKQKLGKRKRRYENVKDSDGEIEDAGTETLPGTRSGVKVPKKHKLGKRKRKYKNVEDGETEDNSRTSGGDIGTVDSGVNSISTGDKVNNSVDRTSSHSPIANASIGVSTGPVLGTLDVNNSKPGEPVSETGLESAALIVSSCEMEESTTSLDKDSEMPMKRSEIIVESNDKDSELTRKKSESEETTVESNDKDGEMPKRSEITVESHDKDSEVTRKRSESEEITVEGDMLAEDTIEELLSSFRRKRRKKKKKRRSRRRRDVEIDGYEISGLERTDVYNPGSEDEEDKALNKQDDMILRKLFKKSGVESAMKHDTIINSGDPDFAIVESEANKVAKSAAKALKDSRQQCLSRGLWGQLTWTGSNGTAGVPKPRFGDTSCKSQGVNDLFSGASSTVGGSLSVSSSVLLAKMKRRNAHHLPEAGGRNIHSTEHHDLLKELRGFIAHQCKRDGQATTDEILNKFAKTLAPSESAVFRSMLHEVCDFHRSHGDGIWTLKSDYR